MLKKISDPRIKLIFFLGFLFLLSVDIFSKQDTRTYIADIRLFSILLLWIVFSALQKLTSRATFILTFILLVILAILFTVNPEEPSAERLATYIYMLLWIGGIKMFLEIRSVKKNKK